MFKILIFLATFLINFNLYASECAEPTFATDETVEQVLTDLMIEILIEHDFMDSPDQVNKVELEILEREVY